MILDKVKEMLGIDDVPEDVSEYYTRAEDLREALYLIREARYRDEQRKSRALEDLKILDDKEQEFLERGKDEENETRRVILAGKVKDIRDKKEEIRHKINEIYKKRISIYAEHMKSLETLVEMEEEAVPSGDAIQEYAVRAREKLEMLDEAFAMAEGVDFSEDEEIDVTEEERKILEEFDEQEKEDETETEETEADEKKEFEEEIEDGQKEEQEEEEPRERPPETETEPEQQDREEMLE